MRTRFSEEQRLQILCKLEESKLTVAEFCRREKLSYGTVIRWRRRAHGIKGAKGAKGAKRVNVGVSGNADAVLGRKRPFVEVEVVGDDGCRSNRTTTLLSAELKLPGGAVLRVFESATNGGGA